MMENGAIYTQFQLPDSDAWAIGWDCACDQMAGLSFAPAPRLKRSYRVSARSRWYVEFFNGFTAAANLCNEYNWRYRVEQGLPGYEVVTITWIPRLWLDG